jgi:hypothetical protein
MTPQERQEILKVLMELYQSSKQDPQQTNQKPQQAAPQAPQSGGLGIQNVISSLLGGGSGATTAGTTGATTAGSGASTTAGAGASTTTGSTAATVGVPAAVALATILAGRTGVNMAKGKQKNWQDASLVDNAGRVLLAMGSFGYSELGNKLFGSKLNHKSTKRHQSDKWQRLADQGIAGVDQIMANGGPTQDTGYGDGNRNLITGGKSVGRDVWGTSGMFDTFGNDWLGGKYSEGQREQIAQAAIDNNLLDSKKGVVRVVDQDRLREIADQLTGVLPNPKGIGNISMQTADALTNQPAPIDAGTLRRWRLLKQGK